MGAAELVAGLADDAPRDQQEAALWHPRLGHGVAERLAWCSGTCSKAVSSEKASSENSVSHETSSRDDRLRAAFPSQLVMDSGGDCVALIYLLTTSDNAFHLLCALLQRQLQDRP